MRRTESQITTDDEQTRREIIRRGDRVSWRTDSSVRQFGRVVRMCTKDFRPAFGVCEEGTRLGQIIPARFITKECG